MSKINLQHFCFGLLCIFNFLCNGAAVDYNPYDYKQQQHLLHAANTANEGYNAQQAAFNVNTVYRPNPQVNSNYQQLYRYYYTPPYQQQQQQQQQQQSLLPQQSTQLWSSPPIVVEDDRRHSSLTDMPATFYQQHSTGSSSVSSLPVLPTTRTRQAYFTHNNNNNNIIYHRDFRHGIYAIPAQSSENARQQGNTNSWHNQNQQQQNRQLLEPQHQHRPQQFYSSDTNLSYNGISNDLQTAASLREVAVPDYRDHFKRYLENNPHRIKPIY